MRRAVRYIAFAALAWALLVVFDVQCPFRALFAIPCPACGVTRALTALLHGDIAAYASFNPMALPLAASVPAVVWAQQTGRKRILGLALVPAAFNFAWWMVRLFGA